MKIAVLVAGMVEEIPTIEADYIGVDYGAYVLANAGRHMVYAVGDFDSVPDMGSISAYADEVKKLNTHKDDSDMEEAAAYAVGHHYDRIYAVGCLGGRLDHEFSNLCLLTRKNLPLILINRYNRIYRLNDGVYDIPKDGYTFLSFFPLTDGEATLQNVAYPLDHQPVSRQDLYLLSNEILSDYAHVELKGSFLVFQSKDQRHYGKA